MTECKVTWHRVRQGEQVECEWCGFPLMFPEERYCMDDDGHCFCTRSCAHRFGGHDSHRRKMSATERTGLLIDAAAALGGALDESAGR